jgi:hypothetical protein
MVFSELKRSDEANHSPRDRELRVLVPVYSSLHDNPFPLPPAMTTSVLPSTLLPPSSSPISGTSSANVRRPVAAPRRGSRTCANSDCQNIVDNHFHTHCAVCRMRRRADKSKAARTPAKVEESSSGAKLMQQAREARRKLHHTEGPVDGKLAGTSGSGHLVPSVSMLKAHTSKMAIPTPSTAHEALLAESARLSTLTLSGVPADVSQLQKTSPAHARAASAIMTSTRVPLSSPPTTAPAIVPPTKKQRLADGSASVSSRTQHSLKNRMTSAPQTSASVPSASASTSRPSALSAAFMAPSSSISDEDDEMSGLFNSVSSREPLRVSVRIALH